MTTTRTTLEIDLSQFKAFYSSTMNDFSKNAKSVISIAQKKANEAIQELSKKIQETPVSPLVIKAHTVTTRIEMAFNIAACLPFIGTAFSGLRILSGKVQAVAGAALLLTATIGYFISKLGQANELTLNKWKIIADFGTENMLHGCLNILRGIGETLIGSSAFGLGSLFLLIPNLSVEPFAPIVKYGELIRPDLNSDGYKAPI